MGDEAFQRKCTDRITGFRENEATVLMVSDNLGLISEMCDRAAWLDHAILMKIGTAEEVIEMYREGFQ